MFVVSSVKSGGEGKDVVAVLPQVIGNIQTAIGCGTFRRASGITARVMVDDPVCQGDVIETAADGRIGIRFIDGTVFNLSPGTRVVMNEFVCDSTGVSHSALFRMNRGAFAFIAGQVSKSGCLRIDTPLGSIRGRANAGGVGMLSLTALIFSAMKEVQAADPNTTFLDDGSITYKDLEHGSFELVTKEAIPRHFFVEDPGKTIVLHAQGSSVSVNQVTNSAARMAELQAAQQDALATYEKGLGSTGSSTPPFVNPLPVQPINFIQTNGSTLAPNSIEPAPWIFLSVPEMIVGKLPPPPPTLNAVTGPIEIDTVAFDVFNATSGTLVASSPNSGAALTYGISGGVAGSTVLNGVTYDVSKTGPYGTLYVNSTAGAYIFVPDGGAINALKVLATTSFTVTVSDGTLSANQSLTITINGTNDAAIISGTPTGSVIEGGGVANATLGTPTATGTLTDTDVDDAPNTFTAVTSPTASAGGYGTFTMTAAGVWTYTLNNTNSTVQALNVGGTLTDTFTVTTVDGTAQVVTIIINGSNDAGDIFGTTSGSVIEAGGTAPGTPVATGTLADSDVDNAANTFTAVTSPTGSNKGYGTFMITAAGVWTYTLDNANSTVQALNAGNTLTDTFTVTTADGTTQVVTVTITGTNDAADISGTTSGSVIEAGGTAPGTPVATGTLADSDVDNAANTFTAVTSPTGSDRGYGTFTMTAAGVWTYTLDNANSTVQALNVGNTLTDTFTVTTADGTTQVVTVTITGTNDAAVISGTTSGSVIEAGGTAPGTPVATGTLADSDVDNAANTFTAVTSPTGSDKGYGTFMITAAGAWTYMLNDDNSAVQALDVGETLTDTFTVTTADGTTQVVTITVHGSSDADPNDFDYLALGDQVISNPPYVYGTPNGETIAGGGNELQIVYAGAGDDTVNGTGRDDTLYSGSGDDTIKGNDGNDTIYGGSGRDTINGNNGNDTVIGGHGGDRLTGSNGDDTFVYLAVADSNSVQFDTILDFASGSDRINLAAFGALAFMALTSTSTSVPPHTLAWIYDSANNETIVYVNPTDQTLDIGAPALLEIHLQGVVSVQESDFVYEPATATVTAAAEAIDPALLATTGGDGTVLTTSAADVSFDSIFSEGTRVADGNWTLSTADQGFSFHFVRSRIDSIGSAKFGNIGETPTHATEDSDGDAVITLANVSSIEPQHGYATELMEDHFTFDQGPIHASAGAMIIGDAAVMPPGGTIDHAGFTGANATAELQLAEHGLTPGSGASHRQSQHDVHTASENASATAELQLAEHSLTPGSGASHGQSQHDAHTATANASNDPHLESNPMAACPGHPTPAGAGQMASTPGLGDSFQFNNEIAGPEYSSAVEVADGDHAAASTAHGGGAPWPDGPAAAISLAEQSAIDHASVVQHHAASHVPHDLIV